MLSPNQKMKMKSLVILLIMLCGPILSAQTSLQLTAGQSYCYEFSTVPFIHHGALDSPGGGVHFYFSSPIFNPGDLAQVRVEMFEGSMTGAPLHSAVFSTWYEVVGFGVHAAWQDLQGSARLTVLSGTVELRGVEVRITGGPGPSLDFDLYGYGHIMPVQPPRVDISRIGANLAEITWPTNHCGYILETAASLPATSWTGLTNRVAVRDGLFSVTIGTGESPRAFRLRKP